MESIKSSYLNEDIEPFYAGGISASISEDGSILATAILEDIVITDVDSNEVLERLDGDDTLVTSLSVTPDGRYLAILSQSQQLRIYNIEQRRFEKTHKMSSPVYISQADKTSSLFVLGGSDGIVTVWDIEQGYITHSLKGHGTTVCSLSFSGDYNSTSWKLASGDIMGTVKVWDLVKRKLLITINEHNSAVRGLGFNKDGSLLVTGGRDQIAVVYETERFKPIKIFSIGEQIESSGFFSYLDGEYIYTAGSENVFKMWNSRTGKLVGRSPVPFRTNEELMILDTLLLDAENIYLVLSDQTLVKIEIYAGAHEESSEIDNVIEFAISQRIAGNHGTIVDIRYVGPEKSLIALATNSPSLRIVDPLKPFEFKLYDGHRDLLNALDVSDDGCWIASASKDGAAIVWKWDDEISDFKIFSSFEGHAGSVTALCLSKLQHIPSHLITGSTDLTVKKWKIPDAEGTVVKVSDFTRRAHERDINSIDISPNDEFFATASYDKLGKIWNFDSGETIGILSGHKRGLWDINFCKYDKLVVTSSGDKSIKVWSLLDFSCLKTFMGHTNAIQRTKFLNRNSQLVSTGADGLIKLWDISQEDNIKTYDNHNNRMWALDVKGDGEEFVCGDADGKISIWIDNSEEERKSAELAKKLQVEQEQKLSNLMNVGDWSNAFLLALTLNHPMKLYSIIRESVATNQDPSSAIGSLQLEETVSKLTTDQLLLLFKKIRDWNVNFKFFDLGQKLIKVIFDKFTVDKMIEIPGLRKIIDSILPYNERHFSRLDDLLEQSYVLDFIVEEMNKAIA